eukprot:Clim_evm166s157 gene=Clim_evmTU166s157
MPDDEFDVLVFEDHTGQIDEATIQQKTENVVVLKAKDSNMEEVTVMTQELSVQVTAKNADEKPLAEDEKYEDDEDDKNAETENDPGSSSEEMDNYTENSDTDEEENEPGDSEEDDAAIERMKENISDIGSDDINWAYDALSSDESSVFDPAEYGLDEDLYPEPLENRRARGPLRQMDKGSPAIKQAKLDFYGRSLNEDSADDDFPSLEFSAAHQHSKKRKKKAKKQQALAGEKKSKKKIHMEEARQQRTKKKEPHFNIEEEAKMLYDFKFSDDPYTGVRPLIKEHRNMMRHLVGLHGLSCKPIGKGKKAALIIERPRNERFDINELAIEEYIDKCKAPAKAMKERGKDYDGIRKSKKGKKTSHGSGSKKMKHNSVLVAARAPLESTFVNNGSTSATQDDESTSVVVTETTTKSGYSVYMPANQDSASVKFAEHKWEHTTSGFGRKMMEKMGYTGGGLGKRGDGIPQALAVESRHGRGGLGAQ